MGLFSTKSFEWNNVRYTFNRIGYRGVQTTFDTDQSAIAAVAVFPASGPTCTVGSASSGLKTVTVAAGGANSAGTAVIVVTHGTTVASGNKG
jgi:hypothetical protein